MGERPIMRMRTRLIASAMALALAACTSAGSSMAPPPPARVNVASLPVEASAVAQNEDELSRAILSAVNIYRTQIGAPVLANDATLQRAAAVHSADMSIRGFFGHYNPDGQGPKERVLAVSSSFNGDLAENLAMVQGMNAKTPDAIARDMLKGWVASPSHRKNLKNAAYTRSGIGIARRGDMIYATELFAGP